MNRKTQILKQLTNLLNSVTAEQKDLPSFVVLRLYRNVLIDKFGVNGTEADKICLTNNEIDQLVLNTSIDISNFSLEDVQSEEFKQFMDAFVGCIGKYFINLQQICKTATIIDMIDVVNRTLTLELSI